MNLFSCVVNSQRLKKNWCEMFVVNLSGIQSLTYNQIKEKYDRCSYKKTQGIKYIYL